MMSGMRRITGCCRGVVALLLCVLALTASASERVQIADPYIDIRTGPGRGYPVFQVAEQHEWIEVLKRRTQWIKVRTRRGREGWVYRQQLARTLDETGEYVAMEDIGQEDYFRPHGEVGVLLGELDGITALTVMAGYTFTENLQLNLAWTEAQSELASNRFISLGIQHHLYPRWRLSPYVLMGAGVVDIEPRTVLVAPDNSSERAVHAGFGVRAWLTRSFVFRTEYRNWVVLTDSNDNDEFEEWRAGFGVLF